MRAHKPHWRTIVLASVALAFVPNEPHPAWYAIPEVVCDAITSDEDQWRCDEDPVTWQRATIPHPVAQALKHPLSAAD